MWLWKNVWLSKAISFEWASIAENGFTYATVTTITAAAISTVTVATGKTREAMVSWHMEKQGAGI